MKEEKTYPKPRERSGVWIYKITEDYTYQSKLTGHEFDSEWLKIESNGKITVKGSHKNGYTWDGCTPKFNVFDLFIIGTPDGIKDVKTGKPKTYYASLIHDALYQYLDSIPFSREEVDLLFYEMLEGFALRGIYYWFVKTFGRR